MRLTFGPIFGLLLAFSTLAQARTEIHTTDDFAKITQEILALANDERAEEILVAFDIDKTLLIVQDCLPEGESKGFAGWLKMANRCPAELTEKEVPAHIAALQKKGFPTLALTARAVNLMKATERELTRNGIVFNGKPFDAAADFNVKFPKGEDLVFKEGVTYAAGRNKGFILQQFQERQSRPFKKVIFVDDAIKNIRHMDKTYTADPDVTVIIYHYNRYE